MQKSLQYIPLSLILQNLDFSRCQDTSVVEARSMPARRSLARTIAPLFLSQGLFFEDVTKKFQPDFYIKMVDSAQEFICLSLPKSI